MMGGGGETVEPDRTQQGVGKVYKNTKVQKYRNTKIQKYIDANIQMLCITTCPLHYNYSTAK